MEKPPGSQCEPGGFFVGLFLLMPDSRIGSP